MSIHLLSPFLYAIFTKTISYIPPCPNSNLMLFLRKFITYSIQSSFIYVL